MDSEAEHWIKDFLVFRRMVTPILIQILYWLLTFATVVLAVIFINNANNLNETIMGFSALILGPLVIRIFAELGILGFRINETLTDIKINTERAMRTRPRSYGEAPRDARAIVLEYLQAHDFEMSIPQAASETGLSVTQINDAIRQLKQIGEIQGDFQED